MEKFYYALIATGVVCLAISLFGLGVVFGLSRSEEPESHARHAAECIIGHATSAVTQAKAKPLAIVIPLPDAVKSKARRKQVA